MTQVLTKSAAIGGDQQSGFEQSFAQLSYAFIRDKAPRLLQYMVGFQLVDRNDDNTKAFGVFGFKVGKQWLYAPVFFLNGDLKGHELMYLKNSDTFIPMKENWLNYVLGKRPHMLGEGSSKDVFQLGGLAPNVEKLNWPPTSAKFGADSGWDQQVRPMLAACKSAKARFLYRELPDRTRTLDMNKVAAAPFQAALGDIAPDLEAFLTSNLFLFKAASDLADKYPLIKMGFDRFHGKDFFQRASLALQQKLADARSIMSARAEAVTAPASDSILPETKAAAGPPVKIEVMDDTATTENLMPRSDEDKGKLVRNGYLVHDYRTGEEVSVAYNTQTTNALSNPSETGIYDVLERPGEFGRMLVLYNPYSNRGAAAFCTVIRLVDGTKAWINLHRSGIFANRIELEDEFRTWFKALPADKELKAGGTYVGVSANGGGTCPFTVLTALGDGKFRVDFKASEKYGYRAEFPRSDYAKDTPSGPYISTYNALLVLNARPDTQLRAVSGELHIPDTFKFLSLKEPRKPRKKDDNILGGCVPCDPCSGESPESDQAPISPGNISDIQTLFETKTASLNIMGDHNEVTIRTEKRGHERLSWQEGLFCLITKHGLREADAEAMLKEAQFKGSAVYRIKYADQYPLPGPGPTAPVFPSPEYGSEQVGYNTVNAIYPQQEHIPVPGLEAGLTDPRIYDPFLMPDRNALMTAQQASESGPKEVFDTAMIGGMLKSVRQDTMVDRHIGDLMKAIDRLGRLLMNFYWHQEQFSDHYGKSELPEMEDAMRNAFESLGDVTLFLKERSVDPDTDSEPSIDDAAKA